MQKSIFEHMLNLEADGLSSGQPHHVSHLSLKKSKEGLQFAMKTGR